MSLPRTGKWSMKKWDCPARPKKQLPHYLQFLKHICFLNRCQLVSAVEARRGLWSEGCWNRRPGLDWWAATEKVGLASGGQRSLIGSAKDLTKKRSTSILNKGGRCGRSRGRGKRLRRNCRSGQKRNFISFVTALNPWTPRPRQWSCLEIRRRIVFPRRGVIDLPSR